MTPTDDPVYAFITAACVPVDGGHQTGTLDRAAAILREHPEVATASVHTAAILGDEATVRRCLARDSVSATATGGPHGWDALTHLCFSRYLRLERERTPRFVATAAALLDAGASANTGWFEKGNARREWESVIYGAAGVAQNAELTRLLLDRGADPNDNETPYHAPETHDNAALQVLVESGKLTAESLNTMLLRKADWHDLEGIRWLLDRGVDPNAMFHWARTPFHQAAVSDNELAIFETFLDHGADPNLQSTGRDSPYRPAIGKTVAGIAARRGRGDALALFARRGIAVTLDGEEKLFAACATGDAEAVRAIAASEPALVRDVLSHGGRALAQFAGNGNTDGVRQLLELGVDVDAPFREGEGYFGIAPNSTALHVAAWRMRAATVKFLLERGASVTAKDAEGRTPLMLAVRACVDSYWTESRTPESVEALLRAGAPTDGVAYPSGYAAVDDLLRSHGARARA